MNTRDAQEKEGAHDHERHSWKYSGIPGIRQYQSSSLFFFPLFPFFPSQTKSNLSSHSLQIIDRSKTSINSYISRYVQKNEERDKKEREELELDSCHAFVTVNCLILCKLLIEVKPPSIYIFPERQFLHPANLKFAGLGASVQRYSTRHHSTNATKQQTPNIDRNR